MNQNPDVSADKVYEFLKEARGVHLLNCKGNLFSDYRFESELLRYETYFQGDVSDILQMENFYYCDKMVAQQKTAGRMKA